MKIGDIAQVQNLVNDAELNGEYVEILKELTEVTVPEFDGVKRTAMRYGIEVLRTKQTGYMKSENLLHLPEANHRAIELHLFGWSDKD